LLPVERLRSDGVTVTAEGYKWNTQRQLTAAEAACKEASHANGSMCGPAKLKFASASDKSRGAYRLQRLADRGAWAAFGGAAKPVAATADESADAFGPGAGALGYTDDCVTCQL
jgi:hypothetical protein